MTMLRDGSCIPSFQKVGSTIKPVTEMWSQWGLRVGQVRDVILPSDKRSVSKKFCEYQVEVQNKDSFGRTSTVLYSNCFVSSPLGGRGDKLRFTHRAAKETSSQGVGEGSKVIVGHINGDRQQAVILGGLRDSEDEPDKDDDGHHLFYEFNGVRIQVTDQGAFSVQYNGATNYDGSRRKDADENAAGTFFKLSADGNATIQHEDQILQLRREEESWWMEAKHKITLKSSDRVTFDAAKTLEMVADEEIYATTRGPITLSARGVSIGSDGATEALVLGSTWRQNEAKLHASLMSSLASLTAALTTASTALATAGASLVVPVVGPVAAGPQVAAAAAALALAIGSLTGMGSSIAEYESQAISILSKKNTTD